MKHKIGYLAALVFGTIWYGSLSVVAGWVRWRRRPGGFWDWVGRDWARLLLRCAGVRVTLRGVEHLAAEGPQILAANHQSFFDILAVLAEIPLPVRFVAKKEMFGIPFLGPAIRAVGHIKIDRGNLKQAMGAYELAARELLARKATVIVFPEGTRSRTGMMLPFKKGPAVLAIESQVPVVPVYCAGTFGILPKGSVLVRPRPVTLHIGPPLSTRGLRHEDRDAFTERLRSAVLELRASSVDASFTPS